MAGTPLNTTKTMKILKNKPTRQLYHFGIYAAMQEGAPQLHKYYSVLPDLHYVRLFDTWAKVSEQEWEEPIDIYIELCRLHGFYMEKKTYQEILKEAGLL